VPINISFDSNLTQNEADALRALLGTLQPAHSGDTVPSHPLIFEGGVLKLNKVVPSDHDWTSPDAQIAKFETATGTVDLVSVDTSQLTNVNEVTPANALSPDLDSDGKEWDEAIHASTRTKTADGRWKKKRGVGKTIDSDPAEDEQAAAEEIEAGPVLAGIPTPPATYAPEAELPVEAQAAKVETVPVPPPPPAPTDSGVPSFPDAVKICSALGKETYTKLFAEVGLKSVMEMKDDTALRERFFGHKSVIEARMEKGV
jgi:hypothetical protein